MKLTSKGRFAVTSLVDMAINSSGNRPISLSEISRRQNISINFLEQIFSSLKKKGIVKSIRGPLGGYIFAKDPSFIMIYDVINATDEELKITRCKGIETSCLSTKKKSKCLTHNLWNNLTNHISSFLSSVSIKDVSDDSYESFFKLKDKEDFRDSNSRNNYL
jgi:Rrf2 family iron-sulfur cluster assembly transcriptional regulator